MPIASAKEDNKALKKQRSPAHTLSEPLSLSSGSVSVKIHPTWNTSRRKASATGEITKVRIPSYKLVYYLGSQREHLTRNTLAKAKAEAALVLSRLRSGEAKALALKGRDRLVYLRATELLEQWKPESHLDAAILDYTNAMRRVAERDISLSEIVKDYESRNQSTFESRTLPDVIEEFIAAKTKRGRSKAYVSTLCRLRNFGAMFSIPIISST